MANYFETALNGMEAALIGVASNAIVYKQGNSQVECNAVFGNTEFEANDYSGFVIEHKMFDFLILVADLAGLTPESGDIITYNGVEYEVVPLGSSPCYQYTTSYRNMFRIHTKEYK